MQLRMADSAYAAFVRLIDERTPGTLAVPGARWANRIAEMEQEAEATVSWAADNVYICIQVRQVLGKDWQALCLFPFKLFAKH